MSNISVTTTGFLSAVGTASNNVAKAGRYAAAFTAAAIIWNTRFAAVYSQAVVPAGQLKKTIKEALTNKGNNVNSVTAWIGDGSRMALSHGEHIEKCIMEYVNDPERNSPATMRGAVLAVGNWVVTTFPTVAELKVQTSNVTPKTKDQKEAAKIMALFNAVNAMKEVRVLQDLANLATTKARLLYGDGNLSPEARAIDHATVASLILAYKSQDEKDQVSEILATMDEEEESNVTVLRTGTEG